MVVGSSVMGNGVFWLGSGELVGKWKGIDFRAKGGSGVKVNTTTKDGSIFPEQMKHPASR